tara:strand:- start:1063 stop:1368 length:306 start_codon:yes stop_codon:yes gene_type:complete
MIEKKLVEKDVEVTVTEKRIVEIYTFEDEEYTKTDLKDKLEREGISLLKDVMNSCRDRNGLAWSTNLRTVRERTDRSDVKANLDSLKKIVEYYEYCTQLED